MGWGAAVSLLRAGIDTTGCDLAETLVERFVAEGGQGVATPAQGAAGRDVIFVFVVNAVQARSVLFGSKGAVAAADLGTVFVLCPTMAPEETVALAADLTAAGMQVIDAPTSGGAAKSAAGEMTLIASGASGAFERAGAALEAISTKVFRLGEEPGMGTLLKMINQHLAGVHIAAMAEAMVLAAREGLDLAQVHAVIRESAGNSWMFENRGPQIVEGDYAPFSAVDIFVKDMGIVRDAAGDLPVALADAAHALF